MVSVLSIYLVYESFFKNRSFVQEDSEIDINSESVSVNQTEEKINSDDKETEMSSSIDLFPSKSIPALFGPHLNILYFSLLSTEV